MSIDTCTAVARFLSRFWGIPAHGLHTPGFWQNPYPYPWARVRVFWGTGAGSPGKPQGYPCQSLSMGWSQASRSIPMALRCQLSGSPKPIGHQDCQTSLVTWITDKRAKAKTIRMHVLKAEHGSPRLSTQDMHRAFPPPLLPQKACRLAGIQNTQRQWYTRCRRLALRPTARLLTWFPLPIMESIKTRGPRQI